MPQSPYQTIVYAPISDLESYRRSVNRYRAEYDSSEYNSYPVDEIVDLAEPLLEQIDFLEKKLTVKKSAFNKLDKSFTALNEEVDDLKGENTALDDENYTLKDENKALRDEVAALKNGADKDIVKE
ncbi:MAG: hypothetical protein LQ341_007802 [Variospora aurantia]|nr:MAG: hypothetical protein LQ341_007802 [Variospora aurantia]